MPFRLFSVCGDFHESKEFTGSCRYVGMSELKVDGEELVDCNVYRSILNSIAQGSKVCHKSV